MEIQNLQEYINNYEITNHINASNFILSILNYFTNNEQIINNIYYIGSELILTTYGKTFYIKNYKDKKEIIDIVKDFILHSKCLLDIVCQYNNGDRSNNIPNMGYILSITKHMNITIFTKQNSYALNINKVVKYFQYLNIAEEEDIIPDVVLVEETDYEKVDIEEKLPSAILVEEKCIRIDINNKDDCEKVEIQEKTSDNILCNTCNKYILKIQWSCHQSRCEKINKLNTIDDITKYMDNLKFPESMINEIKDNIENLKELHYVYGKLQKEEYKKFVITQQHKNSVSRDIIDTKNYINKLMPRNIKDNNEFKKLYMSDYEVKLCFNMHVNQTKEYSDGMNN